MWDTTTVHCLQLQMVHARVKMAWKLPAVVIFTLFPKYAIHIIMPKTKALKSPPLSMRRSLEPPVLQYNGGVSLCNKLNFSQFTWQCKTSFLRISHGKHLKFSVPACHGLEAKSKCVLKHVACWWCCCVHLTVEENLKVFLNKVMLVQTSIHPQGPTLLGKSCPPVPAFPWQPGKVRQPAKIEEGCHKIVSQWAKPLFDEKILAFFGRSVKEKNNPFDVIREMSLGHEPLLL